jgi:hypothetical protein
MTTYHLNKPKQLIKGEEFMRSRLFWYLLLISIVTFLTVAGAVTYANIKYAQEGTVQVVTMWGAIERVYTPSDGWFTTLAPGRKSYEVNIKSFTESAPVRVTSKDNAALQVEISPIPIQPKSQSTFGSMDFLKTKDTAGVMRS